MVLCLFVLFVLVTVVCPSIQVFPCRCIRDDIKHISNMHLNKLVYNVYSWIRKLLFRIICYFLYLFVFLFPLNSGLSTEATSNGFYIDETPPSIKVKPQLSRDLGSIREDSIVFRSTIKVTWEVEDKESYIQRQYLSIASHKGGEFNATSTEVNQIAAILNSY